ncbi:hypothetical protein CSQ89_20180 [Chitinimonas sp. BJB300]|nr:hypothetical protein CSQ89_20180 [Chitinimonas sp. BJB300]
MASAFQPSAADWKSGLQAYLDSGQRVSDWQQTQQQTTWSTFCTRGDMPALINYYQQHSETEQQLRQEILNWQMQIPALLNQQLYGFLHNCMDVRSSGDGMLALSALHESATQQWKAHYENLQQLLSNVSPAYLAGVQQYLQFADTPPSSVTTH